MPDGITKGPKAAPKRAVIVQDVSGLDVAIPEDTAATLFGDKKPVPEVSAADVPPPPAEFEKDPELGPKPTLAQGDLTDDDLDDILFDVMKDPALADKPEVKQGAAGTAAGTVAEPGPRASEAEDPDAPLEPVAEPEPRDPDEAAIRAEEDAVLGRVVEEGGDTGRGGTQRGTATVTGPSIGDITGFGQDPETERTTFAGTRAPRTRPRRGRGNELTTFEQETVIPGLGDPKLEALAASLREDRRNVERNMADVTAAALAGEADIRDRGIEGARDRLENLEDDHRAAMASAQRQLEELQAWNRDVSAQRIDPGHFYSSRGAGARIGASIAVALGHLGTALAPGTANTALSIIESAIENDMQAQWQNIQNQRQGIISGSNLLGDLLSITRDRRAAEMAFTELHLQQVDQQILALQARANSEMEVLALERLHTLADERRATLAAEAAKRNGQITITRRAETRRRRTRQQLLDEAQAQQTLGAARRASFAEQQEAQAQAEVRATEEQKRRKQILAMARTPEEREFLEGVLREADEAAREDREAAARARGETDEAGSNRAPRRRGRRTGRGQRRGRQPRTQRVATLEGANHPNYGLRDSETGIPFDGSQRRGTQRVSGPGGMPANQQGETGVIEDGTQVLIQRRPQGQPYQNEDGVWLQDYIDVRTFEREPTAGERETAVGGRAINLQDGFEIPEDSRRSIFATDSEFEAFKKEYRLGNGIIRNLSRLVTLARNESGITYSDRRWRGAVGTLTAITQLQGGQYYDLGALAGADLVILEEIIPDTRDVAVTNSHRQQLVTALNGMLDQRADLRRSNGIRPIQTSEGEDATPPGRDIQREAQRNR